MPRPGCRECNFMAQLWWCTSAIPGLGRSKREDQKFKFIHGCKYVIQGQFSLSETPSLKNRGMESWLRC